VNVLIVGYGKMGKLIDAMAVEQGFDVAGRVDDGRDEWRAADVAIDFTTADALLKNFPRYLEMKMPVVIGTTGWNEQAAALRAQAEQAPNPDSRVTLGSQRDRFGQPLARVDWRPSASDRASIRASQEVVGAAVREAGLGHVEFMLGDEHPPALLEGNFHHLGTTRMHLDPAKGVVDADCRVHGIRNLYLAGSSLFPTYGCSNPTLTVVALALRLADDLKRQMTD